MFGFKFDLPEGFEDRSTYTFGLPRAEPEGDQTAFRSNVVVVRSPKGDGTLRDLVDKLAAGLQEQAPNMVVVSDNTATVADCDAIERYYRLDLEAPMPTLLQRHLFVERGDWHYHLCCSSTQARFTDDAPKFQALVDAWGE